MIKVSTAKEMQGIDRTTIRMHGVAGTLLMERAGGECVKKINSIYFQGIGNRDKGTTTQRKIIVLAGGGNNGGDGYVIARLLKEDGRDVRVFSAVPAAKLKGDARTMYEAAKKIGVEILPVRKFLTGHASRITRHGLIVDALLGTGLSKDVRAPLSDVIKKINRISSSVLSVDIPSGISSDTGQVMGVAVKADHTVTFGLLKRGHLLYPGADHAGELFIADIGFPKRLLRDKKIRVNLFQREDATRFIPKRPKHSHKGIYGHVLIIAGSRGKTGAALMAAKACLRTGAGLVTIGVPDSLVDVLQRRVTEEMILPLPDQGDGTLSINAAADILQFLKDGKKVLAIGPGLSCDSEISELVAELIKGSKVPILIDADGLNAIAGKTAILKKSKAPVILTPHPGEMQRLLGQQTADADSISTAVSFAKKTGTYLVLKGAPTVTATPDGEAFINSSGNPGMATAGTGDVLTGMISALLAQGLNPKNASILGVYMHGHAGDIAAKKKGEHSLIASDIIKAIPSVFKAAG